MADGNHHQPPRFAVDRTLATQQLWAARVVVGGRGGGVGVDADDAGVGIDVEVEAQSVGIVAAADEAAGGVREPKEGHRRDLMRRFARQGKRKRARLNGLETQTEYHAKPAFEAL